MTFCNCLFLFLVYCDSRKARQLTFLHYSEYHFLTTLRKKNWFRLKKNGVVFGLLFFIRWRGVTCMMQVLVARQLDTRIKMRVSVSSP